MTTAHVTPELTHSPAAALRRRLPRDPLGLVAGFRAYLAFRDLSALPDAALSARGLTRADLPARAAAEITRDL
jgi:hypothetical protein